MPLIMEHITKQEMLKELEGIISNETRVALESDIIPIEAVQGLYEKKKQEIDRKRELEMKSIIEEFSELSNIPKEDMSVAGGGLRSLEKCVRIDSKLPDIRDFIKNIKHMKVSLDTLLKQSTLMDTIIKDFEKQIYLMNPTFLRKYYKEHPERNIDKNRLNMEQLSALDYVIKHSTRNHMIT